MNERTEACYMAAGRAGYDVWQADRCDRDKRERGCPGCPFAPDERCEVCREHPAICRVTGEPGVVGHAWEGKRICGRCVHAGYVSDVDLLPGYTDDDIELGGFLLDEELADLED